MRPSWEQYALNLAKVASERSEDLHVKVGCVVLGKENEVLSVGYNGSPSGINIDWNNREERRKKVVHAEQNALRYCKPGQPNLLACTLLPCNSCLTLIASYGIKKIVYQDIYDKDDSTLKLAKEFGIELIQINTEKLNFLDKIKNILEEYYNYGYFNCDIQYDKDSGEGNINWRF